MKKGYLSQYFKGVALKILSEVETDPNRSNQHEFNGMDSLRDLLGEPVEKVHFPAKFIYLSDHENEPIIEDGLLTWYDARAKRRVTHGVMRWEYRLYFTSNLVMQNSSTGDVLVIARQTDDTLLAIVAEKESTIEKQIRWLFGFSDVSHPGFSVKSELETEQDRLGFAARLILEQIGLEIEEADAPSYLDHMLEKFDGAFPRTAEFSSYARSTVSGLSSLDDPDAALIAWMEREEILFRTLEKHLLGEKLRNLTQERVADTEPFIKLVQSALQRRRSRAGSALENHLEQVFTEHGITYTRSGMTENRLKPDFIFPGIDAYHTPSFPQSHLTMLASKSTCKDRWRQILNEAARIPAKHLLTLEPSISSNQTDEMKAEQVQLVIPFSLHVTYTPAQQSWLLDIADFLRVVKERQTA